MKHSNQPPAEDLQETLRAQRDFPEQILETARVIVLVLDLDGRIVRFNRYMEEVSGYALAEVVGKNWFDIFLPSPDRERIEKVFRTVIRKPSAHLRVNAFLTKDGRQIPIEWSNDVLRDADGKVTGVLATGREVSAGLESRLRQQAGNLRRTNKALRESEERLQAAQRIARVGDWDWDIEAGGITWSDEVYRIFGLARDDIEVTIDTFAQYIHPDDRDAVMAAVDTTLADRKPYSIVHRIVRPDGSIRHVHEHGEVQRDDSGTAIRMHGTVHDVTELKQAESEARSGRQRMLDVIDTMNVFVGILTPDGILIEANSAPLEAAGLLREDVLGKPFWETPWWSYSPEVQMKLREALKRTAEGELVRYDVPIQLSDGMLRTIDVTFAPLYDAQGDVTQLVSSAIDVTDRKNAEKRVEDSLREKEILLQEIHHRFKNNLQVISSLLYFQAEQVGDEATRAMFHESRDRVRTLALIHETLYGAEDLGNIALAPYINRLIDGLRVAYGDPARDTIIETDMDDALIDVGRALPIGLIVNELVTNALKYAFPNGGPGIVRVAFSGSREAGFELVVSDDGVGLPAGLDLDSLSTLGLRMVGLLADQLGGTLEVTGTPRRRFYVRFAEADYEADVPPR